ncbi:MAG: energy transducer TonB [Geothrix sp.]|uniref:energy transducer TonB n=1 Tax=Geothrix sp. TaxID=1962974 RepID=UPI003BAEBA43
MLLTATSPPPSLKAGSVPALEGGVLDLPPTLQPAAIFRAAPPRPRRLSALVTLNVYAGLLLLAWPWIRPAGAGPLHQVPRQTMTLLFEEPSAPAPLSLAPSIQGGASSPEQAVRALTLIPDPNLSDLIVPMEDRSRDLPEPPQAAPMPAEPSPAIPDGVGHGTGLGRGDGRGIAKGSGRAMFRAVPGLNPELDLRDLEVIHEEIPSYPLLAEWGRIQGDVVVRVTINEKGIPIRTELQEGPDALQAETMRAVKRWRFGRGIFRGRKVDATFDMTFRFILR